MTFPGWFFEVCFFKQSSPNRLTRCGLSHPCPVPSHIGFGPLRSALSGERSCFMHQAPQKKRPAHHRKRKNDNAGVHKVFCMYVDDNPPTERGTLLSSRLVGSPSKCPPQPPLQHCHSSTGAMCLFFFLALSDGSSASVLSLSDLQ